MKERVVCGEGDEWMDRWCEDKTRQKLYEGRKVEKVKATRFCIKEVY